MKKPNNVTAAKRLRGLIREAERGLIVLSPSEINALRLAIEVLLANKEPR